MPTCGTFFTTASSLGLAAQTADVVTLNTSMRRMTLLHSTLAFYYNTVVLALAINAAAALGLIDIRAPAPHNARQFADHPDNPGETP